MITQQEILQLVGELLDPEKEFLIAVNVSPRSEIRIVLDSMEGITIDRCSAISRAIEGALDRDKEDFSLEVSSAGLGEPFIVLPQYKKNLGNPVAVILKSGIREEGTLVDADVNGFSITVKKTIPAFTDEQGKKHKKQQVDECHHFLYDEVKSVAYHFVK